MMDQEWLAFENGYSMPASLRGRFSIRKLRLFECACFRRMEHLLLDERSRAVVNALELFADGQIGLEELDAVGREAGRAAGTDAAKPFDISEAAGAVVSAILAACASIETESDDETFDEELHRWREVSWSVRKVTGALAGGIPGDWQTARAACMAQFAKLWRDIFGPLPF